MMSCANAAASSFAVVGEAQAPQPIGSAGSSIIALGEPVAPIPVTSIPGRPVDATITASVGDDPRSDAAPPAKSPAAMAAEEWSKISSNQSRSVLYFGQPDPTLFKAPEPEPQPQEQAAAFDPRKMPMVMRGGIFGDLSVAPDEEASVPSADATGEKLSRREQREKARAEARAQAEAAAAPQPAPVQKDARK